MALILIIDDDKAICTALAGVVTSMGHDAASALTLEEGLQKILANTYDVVLLDVRLPDGNGLKMLPTIRETSSAPEVIIITGEGSHDGAELAIESGAWDYMEKPVSTKEITLQLTRVLQYRQKKSSPTASFLLMRDEIIGSSSQIRSCLALVTHAANNDSNVLITGETGTGKELFARAIHENSKRAGKNFVVVDCGALTETLVECIIFGHQKGAFTGADKTREGLIKQADGGTLFLDEVGELPQSVQPAFLRVLQERRFRPVGGQEEIASDFRLVAATNRDLDQLTQAAKFRRDLLFRLQAIHIDLPPLRKRGQDIRSLAFHYMAQLCDHQGLGLKGFSPEFFEALTTYSWPGNVRELVNTLESALSLSQSEPTLFPFHLPKKMRIKLARSSISKQALTKPIPATTRQSSEPFPDLRLLIEKTERAYFQNLVQHTKGNIQKVCRICGLSRANVYKRLKKYNISHQ